MTWKNQNLLKKKGYIPIPSELLEIVNRVSGDRDRALISLLYLTAGRISEVIALRRGGIYRDDEFYIIKIPNRKHKKRFWKEIPISPHKEADMQFFNILRHYYEKSKVEGKIFNIKRDTARKMVTRKTGINPHWFRHIRLSHLRRYYKFDGSLLQRYAGWTNLAPAAGYLEVGIEDFKDKLK